MPLLVDLLYVQSWGRLEYFILSLLAFNEKYPSDGKIPRAHSIFASIHYYISNNIGFLLFEKKCRVERGGF